MTHNPKLSVSLGHSTIECSCQKFTKAVKGGSREDRESALTLAHTEHAKEAKKHDR